VGSGFNPPEAVDVKTTNELVVGVGVSVEVGELVKVKVEVSVSVNVALATSESSLNTPDREKVGVKKSKANASLVKARSRGVDVAVNLGVITISSCVSGLPPAIIMGNPKANAHATMMVNTTMAPCAFILLKILSYTHLYIPGNCQITGSVHTYLLSNFKSSLGPL